MQGIQKKVARTAIALAVIIPVAFVLILGASRLGRESPEEAVSSRLFVQGVLPVDAVSKMVVYRVDREEFLDTVWSRSLRGRRRTGVLARRDAMRFAQAARQASETSSYTTGDRQYYWVEIYTSDGSVGVCTVSNADYLTCYTKDFVQLSGYPVPGIFERLGELLRNAQLEKAGSR